MISISSCSDPTDRQHIHTLLEEDFVDPWGQDKDGRLHFRLSVQLWAKLQDKFPECTVAIENVEEYVRAVEREMFNSTRLGADWFEAYVSLCKRVVYTSF